MTFFTLEMRDPLPAHLTCYLKLKSLMRHLALFVITLLSLGLEVGSFRLTRNMFSPRGESLLQLCSTTGGGGAAADLREIASRFKVVPYGIGSNEVRASIESRDPTYRDVLLSVVLSKVGGLGLELEEAERLERGNGYGLSLIHI